MEENKEMEKFMCDKVNSEVERLINKIVEDKLQVENVELLGELVDIHKDLSNEKYWKVKEEYYMRYDTDYGRRMRDSRGRYMDGDYGRRGVRGTGRRYRGHDMLDDMHEAYSDYMEGAEYGEEGMESIEAMMSGARGFFDHIMKIARTPEERQYIKHELEDFERMM